jgi:RecA/RadA recombinase
MSNFAAAADKLRDGWRTTLTGARALLDDTRHVCSGALQLDLSGFGGVPTGSQIQLVGGEAMMKTWLSLEYAVFLQRVYPKMKVVYIRVEPGGLDMSYAIAQGINPDNFVVWPVESGEAAAEAIIHFFAATDVIMVILDSIPVMLPATADKRNWERMEVAQAPDRATLVGRVVASCAKILIEDSMLPKPRKPILCWINQWRTAPTSFGDPRYAPSTGALKFQSRSTIELHIPNKQYVMRKDEALGKDVPCYNEIDFTIKKTHGARGVTGSFIVNVDHQHPMLKPGQIADLQPTLARAVGYGLLTGGAGKFEVNLVNAEGETIGSREAQTQKKLENILREDKEFTTALRDCIIGMHRKSNNKSFSNWKAGE